MALTTYDFGKNPMNCLESRPRARNIDQQVHLKKRPPEISRSRALCEYMVKGCTIPESTQVYDSWISECGRVARIMGWWRENWMPYLSVEDGLSCVL